jgi:nucleotide-binding universal stress UspA family protein
MEKIVVGIDGSEESRNALRFAVEEGEAHGARVVALHAWEAPVAAVDPSLTAPPVDYPALLVEVREAAERFAETFVEEAVGDKRDRVEPLAVEGSAAAALLDAAEDADLVVVGSRGHGGFARLVLGSVSEQVAHHAPCPVVIHRTRESKG